MFFIHFFVSIAINLGIFTGSLYLNDDYKLYIPFFHISVICLIVTIALLFSTDWYFLILHIILALGMICCCFWLFLIKKLEIAFTFGIVVIIIVYYIIFSCRTVTIMSKDSDTSVIQYNKDTQKKGCE